MKPQKFRALFSQQNIDGFSNQPLDGSVTGYGYAKVFFKRNSNDSPYRLASEYVAAQLGRIVGLPIPPCGVTYYGDESEPLFSSFDFNQQRARLPPIIPELFVKKLPFLAAGILVFDIFIGNEDRHEENLVVDRVNSPKEVHVFDHDQSLLTGLFLSGTEKLHALTNNLGVTGAKPFSSYRHVFIDHVSNEDDLLMWADRIGGIRDYMIDDQCDFCEKEFGLDPSIGLQLRHYLKSRRSLRGLIKGFKNEFSSIVWKPDSLI